MNADTIVSATGDLGVRFRFVSLLPVAMLTLYVLALAWSGAPARAPSLGRVVMHAKTVAGWQAFLLAVAIVAVALIAEPLQVTLVRLLEGYWGQSRVGRLLAAPGIAVHRRRRERLDRAQRRTGGAPAAAAGSRSVADREEAARKLRAYPPEPGILPTMLGNILRSAEHRAGSRYGLDAIIAWPRLYPLLSDKVTAVLRDLRDQLDLVARFCAVFAIAAVVSAGFLATHGWWLAVTLVPLGGALLSYRAALAAAAAYGQAVEAAVDLHRFDLRTALHLPLPADLRGEVAANQQLTRFLRQPAEYLLALGQDREANLAYRHPAGTDGRGGQDDQRDARTPSRSRRRLLNRPSGSRRSNSSRASDSRG
jgi:hypothetical protein